MKKPISHYGFFPELYDGNLGFTIIVIMVTFSMFIGMLSIIKFGWV